MMNYSAIIIEDSRLARNDLKELLVQHPQFQIVAEAENIDNALIEIKKHNPQLIFLDINMPGGNGFSLLEKLDQIPVVIFTTAYDEFAIKAFEYNAFDYLLKPISQTRFDQTIKKLIPKLSQKHTSQNKKLTKDSQIFIKEGEDCWMIALSQVSLFETLGNYTKVYFQDNCPLIYKSLNKISDNLPDDVFFRANRQQIINLNHIENVEVWFKGSLKITLKNKTNIEISRRQSIQLRQMLAF